VHEEVGRRVVELAGAHRLHDAEVVDDVRDVRQQFAHPRARLAVLRELVGRAEDQRPALDERELLSLQDLVGTRLHVQLDQLRLPVEEIVLRRRARHVEVDHRLRPRREHRRPDGERVVEREGRSAGSGRAAVPAVDRSRRGSRVTAVPEQLAQRERPQRHAPLAQEPPPRDRAGELAAEFVGEFLHREDLGAYRPSIRARQEAAAAWAAR
jgi:hypothetical protein